MPGRDTIYREISKRKQVDHTNSLRKTYLKKINKHTGNNIIHYSSAWTTYTRQDIPGVAIMITPHDMPGFMTAINGMNGDNLDIIIHSPGGSADATEQIVNYLRAKFKKIRVIIPQSAMSAATMLACAADEIIMGKHSAIGPIDPQIIFNNFSAPAQAILEEFEEAKKSISSDPNTAPLWIKRIDKYPQGVLKMCENLISLSQERVQKWLAAWMFADDPKRDKKAKEIATWLGVSSNHKTHGRPIGMEEAIGHGLRIIPLESDPTLQEGVLSLFHATCATHEMTNCVKLIENQNGVGVYIHANPNLPR